MEYKKHNFTPLYSLYSVLLATMLIVVGFLYTLLPTKTYASVIAQQLDNSQNVATTTPQIITQELGTGLSTASSTIYATFKTSFASGTPVIVDFHKFSCSSYNYSDCGTGVSSITEYVNSSGDIKVIRNWEALVNTNYYSFQLRGSTGFQPQNIKGSSDPNSYTSGRACLNDTIGVCYQDINVKDIYFYISSSNENPPFDNTTRFISFTPELNATVSTTTLDVGTQFYIGEELEGADLRLTIQYMFNDNLDSNIIYADGDDASDSPVCTDSEGTCIFVVQSIFEDIETGEYGFSRLTQFIPSLYSNATSSIGYRSVKWTIEKSCFLFLWCDVIETDSYFILGEKSIYDNIRDNIGSGLTDIFSASSTAVILSDCSINFISFNPVKCLYSLVVPSADQFAILGDNFKANMFSKAPFGYGYRVINLFNSFDDYTGEIPNFSITFPSTSIPMFNASSTQIFADKTIVFVDWDKLENDMATTTNNLADVYDDMNQNIITILNLMFAFWLIGFIIVFVRIT